jgi:hypothetical protein
MRNKRTAPRGTISRQGIDGDAGKLWGICPIAEIGKVGPASPDRHDADASTQER